TPSRAWSLFHVQREGRNSPWGLFNATRVDQPYSSLMLAARITLPHFSVSSPMNLPNSFGEVGNAVAPSSAIRALILGSPSAALISVLSLWMISAGVSFGAPRPPQALASYPGKKSATVGIFGSASERVAVATASARSLPALMCSMDAGRLSNAISTCPPTRSVSMGPEPRYGTWSKSTPAIILNNSPATGDVEPTPNDAIVILPGWALA